MSNYVESNLTTGEEIILKATKSVWGIIPSIIGCFITFAIALIFSLVWSDFIGIPIMFWVLFVLSIIEMVSVILKWYSMELCITNKRVIGKMGVISVHTLDYMISKVDNVCIETGFWGNIFHYHKVIVRGGGEIDGRHRNKNAFIGITNAYEFKNVLAEAVEKHTAQARKAQAEEIARVMQSQENKTENNTDIQ